MPVDKQKQYERQAKWDKENRRNVVLRLVKTTDADLLEYLDGLPNKQGYIKALIRADMEKHKSE